MVLVRASFQMVTVPYGSHAYRSTTLPSEASTRAVVLKLASWV